MNESGRKESERHYLVYQRLALVCLFSAVAAGVYFVAAASGWLDGRLSRDAILILITLFTISFIGIPFVTLRGRLWRRSDPDAQLILRDEWIRRNRHRAAWIGFVVVMWAQFPLALLMKRLGPEPSLSGMAGVSMTLGIGVFWAAYLYVGRQQGDE